ncbi:adenine DNA glycosylase [Ixodes scapularis]|uniref:adenine DNA glycosylase n=1 Tax=Ixodes scapularis TaxID=6945 RepID=UPI001A9E90D5|nr:adenine DNA glycosylase [Ixodes scapularis]
MSLNPKRRRNTQHRKETGDRKKMSKRKRDSSEQKSVTVRSTKDPETPDIPRSCPFHNFSVLEVAELRGSLLGWYDEHQRQLPWRDIAKADGDPNQKAYAVWVSEIMLQQTRVTTVIEYYKRWMKKWPTVGDLARASIEEVLQAWAGLGYYQRARRLHEGAQKVVRDLGGLFPNTPKRLAREIPGVGCYTAAAVASIAFGHPAGAVDGNVARVYSRMRLLGATLGSSPSERALWAAANEAVCPVRPGDFNQAVMELGAGVCTPRSPSCTQCPVRSVCLLYQTETAKKSIGRESAPFVADIEAVPGCGLCLPSKYGNTEMDATQLYPHKAAKKKPRRETHAVSVLRSGDRYLLLRKTGQGRLLEGLWEFPNRQVDPQGLAKKSQDEERRVVSQINAQLLNSAGGKKRARRLGEVTHLFSHIHATYCVYETTLDEECETEGSWMSAAEVESSGVSTAMKKVLSLAAGRAIEKPRQRSKSSVDPRQQKLNFTSVGSKAST